MSDWARARTKSEFFCEVGNALHKIIINSHPIQRRARWAKNKKKTLPPRESISRRIMFYFWRCDTFRSTHNESIPNAIRGIWRACIHVLCAARPDRTTSDPVRHCETGQVRRVGNKKCRSPRVVCSFFIFPAAPLFIFCRPVILFIIFGPEYVSPLTYQGSIVLHTATLCVLALTNISISIALVTLWWKFRSWNKVFDFR